MNNHKYLPKLYFVFFFFFPGLLPAQATNRLDSLRTELTRSQPDTQKVYLLFHLYGETLYNDPDQALAYATEAKELAEKLDHRRGLVLSYEKMGGLYYNSSDMDRARFYYGLADSLLQGMNWPREQAVIYGNYAGLYKDIAVYDTALYWNDRFLEIAEQLDNDYFRGYGLTITGDIYHVKGQHNLAGDHLLRALRIYETLGDTYREADALMKLGEVQMAAKHYEDAEINLKKAIERYEEVNDAQFAGQAIRGLAGLYIHLEEYDKAEPLIFQGLERAKELGDTYGVAQSEEYLGDIAWEREQFDSAFLHYQAALPIYQEIGDNYNMGSMRTSLAWVYYGLKNYDRALAEAKLAAKIIQELETPALDQANYEVLYRIYQAIEQPRASLLAFQDYINIKDSLYTVEKAAQLEELQLIYSIEKKDQEIELLAKDVQLGQVKRQRLLGGLVSLAIMAALVIYLQYIRRQRDRRIQEETRRRRQLELEKTQMEKAQVERELTAQVLQLCRKNELLASVQQEIKVLGAQSNQINKPSLKRLERSIQTDINSDEDWRQFLSTFENVHPDFLDQLRSRVEKLTSAEQRLACLMKMNLSSKEIATLLNITDEGVKKGRYRLRKKLGVVSEVGLQEYLINFPSDN